MTLPLHTYVALDLETTGGDPLADGIMEIAIVRFTGGREVASRAWLTNPGQPIPMRWQQLTGITGEMVADKPRAEAVLGDLLSFVGGSPLVAHDAALDAGFLAMVFRRAGLSAPPKLCDSAELARLVLPLARSHRLAMLAAELGISVPGAHRAEEDARTCGQVFARCLERLQQMELAVLNEWLRLAPYDWPLRPLVEQARREQEEAGVRPRPVNSWIAPADRPLHVEQQAPARRTAGIDPDEVAGILAPGGPVAQAHVAYESRPQQVEMARVIAEQMNSARHLLVEAGTGTGKSLAYLVPALLWARASGETVVVSTHTITLQEQLWKKDIPFLLQALGCEGEVEVALVKGRSNYVCLRRWEEASLGADFATQAESRFFSMRALTWLGQTETGDRAELQVMGGQEEYWNEIMSESETCLGPKCKWFSRHCFAFRARQRARDARILVVNHALLFSDIRAGGGVLPRFANLVIDEAHHLEQVATEHLGTTVSQRDVLAALHRLFRGFRAGQGTGLLPRVRQALPRPLPAHPPLGGLDRDLPAALVDLTLRARDRLQALFAALGQLLVVTGSEGEGARSLRLTPAIQLTDAWSQIDALRPGAVAALKELAQGLAALGAALGEQEDESRPRELDGLVAELAKYTARLREQAEGIETVLLGNDEDYVYWVEGDPPRRPGADPQTTLRAAPVHVGDLLRTALFDRLRSVVMTSATLAVGGRFDHLRQQLGLGDLPADRLVSRAIPSPFAYREQALVLIPNDVPSPRAAEDAYQHAITGFLRDFLPGIGGRTLVLFTSHRQLRQVYNTLKSDLESAGLLLLAQGLDGQRGRLVEEFKGGRRAVLFGSASFWEGVDIPGVGLSCVVMARLPFAPPDDPVTAARIEHLERRGYSAFTHLTLPQAVIRFKQGFGRLIRSMSDRGVMVVLDNRVHPSQTRYGSQFIRSLPGPRVRAAPSATIAQLASEFLGVEL